MTNALLAISGLVTLVALVIGGQWIVEWWTFDRHADDGTEWATVVHRMTSDAETDTHLIIGMAHYRAALAHIETATVDTVRSVCDTAIAALLDDKRWATCNVATAV